MQNGVRCLARVLLTYQGVHKLTTLRQIINRWAPESENDTDAYLDHVCQFCCASPDNPFTLTPSRLLALAKAIIKFENGQSLPDDVVLAGVDAAFT